MNIINQIINTKKDKNDSNKIIDTLNEVINI